MKQRRTKLTAALETVRARDEARRKAGINPAKNPAQLPMNDQESSVMPNKEGGYAPNYTPTCLTDGAKGFIVDSNVLGCINETNELVPAVDRTTDMLGEKPNNVLTDSGNAAGSVRWRRSVCRSTRILNRVDRFAATNMKKPGIARPSEWRLPKAARCTTNSRRLRRLLSVI